MTWTDITENWTTALTHLEARFPLLSREALAQPPKDLTGLTRHLAATHDLTDLEASEELADWLFVQALSGPARDRSLH